MSYQAEVALNDGRLIVKGKKPMFNCLFEIKSKTKSETGVFETVLIKKLYALRIVGVDEADPQSEELFTREIDMLKKMAVFEHFPSVYRYGTIEDRAILDALGCTEHKKAYFIVMDHVYHKLDEWIDTLKTEEDVRILFRQICDIVLRLNTMGFIHKYLKPASFMYDVDKISGERVVKLVDFGLTKQGDCTIDTNLYMAPEAAEQEGKEEQLPCPLADIWSLGIILLEILIRMSEEAAGQKIGPNPYKRAPAFIDDITCVQWVKFPNCRVLLNRLLAREDSRITVEELKAYKWLDLNVDGIVCGHYKIDYNAMLGKGSFGFVSKGVDLHTNRPVSIKRMLKPDDFTPEDFEKYSLAEINNLLKLKGHPNILEIFGYERVEEIQYEKSHAAYYVVTELCDGTWKVVEEDEEEEIMIGEKPESKPVEKIPKECIQQMCNGLTHINVEMKMVHRDIKPQNIMYVIKDGRKVVKLIDFGTSKKADLAKTNCGTDGYKAPELYSGVKAHQADKLDIYSLGATFACYMRNGLLPDDFPVEVIEKMTKPKYAERMSWDEFMKIPYFGYSDSVKSMLTDSMKMRRGLKKMFSVPK